MAGETCQYFSLLVSPHHHVGRAGQRPHLHHHSLSPQHQEGQGFLFMPCVYIFSRVMRKILGFLPGLMHDAVPQPFLWLCGVWSRITCAGISLGLF
jgi:hypothetical protein